MPTRAPLPAIPPEAGWPYFAAYIFVVLKHRLRGWRFYALCVLIVLVAAIGYIVDLVIAYPENAKKILGQLSTPATSESKSNDFEIKPGNNSVLVWHFTGKQLTDQDIKSYQSDSSKCGTQAFSICYLSGGPSNLLFYGFGDTVRVPKNDCRRVFGKCYIVGGEKDAGGARGWVSKIPN